MIELKYVKILKKVNMKATHRMDAFRNMLTSLVKYGRLETSHIKAKNLQICANLAIQLAKEGGEENKDLEHDLTIPKIFDELALKYQHIDKNYVRLTKLYRRYIDDAPITLVEFIGTEQDSLVFNLIREECKKRIDNALTIEQVQTELSSRIMDKKEFIKYKIMESDLLTFDQEVTKVKQLLKIDDAQWEGKILEEVDKLNLELQNLESERKRHDYIKN